MAFRNAEMSVDDAGRVVRRWLREFLLEDWGLKLLALVITLVLWFAVTGQRAPSTLQLRGVALEYLRPAELEIGNEPLDEVDITLEGGKSRLEEINARNLVARVDISQLRPGERILRLSRENVSMDLPEGVRIVRIEPQSVALKVERSVERELEVEARLEGTPAEGYEVRGVQITPPRVKVRGPESRVGALDKAFTETIPLDGQRETLNAPQVAVDVSDRSVVALDAAVAVRVEIAETQAERRIANVAVRAAAAGAEVRPQTLTAVVAGPRSIVERLRPEDLTVVIEQAPDGSLRPRLAPPPGLEGRLTLVSVTPSDFTIQK
jgi:YbbR domain-containing protein